MKNDALIYDMPWRPNYEVQAVFTWASAATVALVVNKLSQMPPEPFYWMGGICGVMAATRIPSAYRLHRYSD